MNKQVEEICTIVFDSESGREEIDSPRGRLSLFPWRWLEVLIDGRWVGGRVNESSNPVMREDSRKQGKVLKSYYCLHADRTGELYELRVGMKVHLSSS